MKFCNIVKSFILKLQCTLYNELKLWSKKIATCSFQCPYITYTLYFGIMTSISDSSCGTVALMVHGQLSDICGPTIGLWISPYQKFAKLRP